MHGNVFSLNRSLGDGKTRAFKVPQRNAEYHCEKNSLKCTSSLHTQFFNLSLMNSGPKLKKYIEMCSSGPNKNVFFLFERMDEFRYKKNSYFSCVCSCFAIRSHNQSVSLCSLSNNTSYVSRQYSRSVFAYDCCRIFLLLTKEISSRGNIE